MTSSFDFVCFCGEAAADAVNGLARNDGSFGTLLYILISTDSVYMSLPVKAKANAIVEEQSRCRPTLEQAAALQQKDAYQYQYGSGKLAAEDIVSTACASRGFPGLIFRLPDVWGEWNNLDGFLDLLEDCERRKALAAKNPWMSSRSVGTAWVHEHRVSLVYASDVAAAIVAASRAPEKCVSKILHIAGREHPSIFSIYEKFANA